MSFACSVHAYNFYQSVSRGCPYTNIVRMTNMRTNPNFKRPSTRIPSRHNRPTARPHQYIHVSTHAMMNQYSADMLMFEEKIVGVPEFNDTAGDGIS